MQGRGRASDERVVTGRVRGLHGVEVVKEGLVGQFKHSDLAGLALYKCVAKAKRLFHDSWDDRVIGGNEGEDFVAVLEGLGVGSAEEDLLDDRVEEVSLVKGGLDLGVGAGVGASLTAGAFLEVTGVLAAPNALEVPRVLHNDL